MTQYYYDRAEAAAWMRQDGWTGIADAIEAMDADVTVVTFSKDGDVIVPLLSEESLSTVLTRGQVRVLLRECGYYTKEDLYFAHHPA
jgi:hypothetical protein